MVFAQPSVRLLRDKIKIGEQTELIYQFKGDVFKKDLFPKHEKVIKCAIIGNKTKKSTDLEIIGLFNDTLIKNKNEIVWEGSYVITCWDSGTVIIPSVEFQMGDKKIAFLPVRIQVTSPKIIEGKDVYDIRTYFASLPTKLSSFFREYGWLILFAILGLVIIYLLVKRSKKSKKSIKKEISFSLKQSTLKQIDELTSEKLWEQEKLKEHYVRLSFLLRAYLAKRYNLSLLDKTSFQICSLLSKCELHVFLQKDIQKVLDQSDLVKFAKSEPLDIEILNISVLAKEIVEKTSPANE
jgi:hypothetical protein